MNKDDIKTCLGIFIVLSVALGLTVGATFLVIKGAEEFVIQVIEKHH